MKNEVVLGDVATRKCARVCVCVWGGGGGGGASKRLSPKRASFIRSTLQPQGLDSCFGLWAIGGRSLITRPFLGGRPLLLVARLVQ